ncbi:MAG: PfkB family carbohydrate kinase, partial [Fimbriimonadales bacterium]
LLKLVDLLALNEEEAGVLCGRRFGSRSRPLSPARCASILQTLNLPQMIVSLGRRGALALDGAQWTYCPAPTVPVASTAGSGDALLAGVLAAIAAGVPFSMPGATRAAMRDGPPESALDFGVLLASYTATSPHTIHPDASVPALVNFARNLGVTFTGSLARAVGYGAGG